MFPFHALYRISSVVHRNTLVVKHIFRFCFAIAKVPNKIFKTATPHKTLDVKIVWFLKTPYMYKIMRFAVRVMGECDI